jgi:hypothetical protein
LRRRDSKILESYQCRVCGEKMALLDEDACRWYCYKDEMIFYADENRWVEPTNPPRHQHMGSEALQRLRNYTISAAAILLLAMLLDTISTVAAFLSYPGKVVEVSNFAVMYFMYNMGWGLVGLFLGLGVTWLLELLLIFLAFRWTRPTAVVGVTFLPLLLLIMVMLAALHLLAFASNLAGWH